jgi:hypothetical protein
MSAREDYRQFAQEFAQECLRLAAEAKDDRERQIFLEMADAWTVIAFEAPFVIEHATRSA